MFPVLHQKIHMITHKRKFGDIGEGIAQDFLLKKDFVIFEKNYQKPWGEIDIVAKKDGIIRFIEVKTSKYYPNSGFTPEIRVDNRKIKALKRVCETYLAERRLLKIQEWQIDVISVILNEDDSVHEINHIENAIFEKQY